MGCHSLLQGIFLTQGLNPGLLHYRQTLCHLSHQGSLRVPVFKFAALWRGGLIWSLEPPEPQYWQLLPRALEVRGASLGLGWWVRCCIVRRLISQSLWSHLAHTEPVSLVFGVSCLTKGFPIKKLKLKNLSQVIFLFTELLISICQQILNSCLTLGAKT